MLRNEHSVLIALGANVARPPQNPSQQLHAAIARLSGVGGAIRSVSRFYQTPCFPAGAGPDYVNAVIAMSTSLPRGELLAALHGVEAEFDRQRTSRWAARTLDLDLLTFDAEICPDLPTYSHWRQLEPDHQATLTPEQLILPHPRLQDRGFVLVPLVDIAPDWIHPVLGITARQMLAALPEDQTREIVPI